MPSPFLSLPPPKKVEIAPVILLFVAAALTILFAALIENIGDGDLHDFDRAVFMALRHADAPERPLGPLWLHGAARDVTSLGSPAVLTLIVFAALGFLALKRLWGEALFVIVSICGGTALSSGLKIIIQRPRPDVIAALSETQTYSFPSGHAFLATVTFLTLGVLLARVERAPEVKLYLIAVAIALTVLVGVSRVYIGMHWPSDVMAGWCAGAVWAILCWLGANRFASRINAFPD